MVTVRPFRDDDADDIYRLRRLSFGGPREIDPNWTDQPGWRGFVAELADRRAGFLRIWDYRQFFGGVAVPTGGIASVAVAPHARGRGVAGELLRAALDQMRAAGQVIATLYPSVPTLYRRYGWEQVGTLERVVVAPETLAALPKSDVEVRPATEADLPALRQAYLRMAAAVDGMLDRGEPPFTVARVLELDVVDVVPGPDGLRGYVTADRPDGDRLIVHDLVADDADTARALLRGLGSWAGQLREVRLRVLDPAVHDLVLPRVLDSAVDVHPWMLRVVDLPAAVAARGWPAAEFLRPFEVSVEVVDEHAPWQAGRYRIMFDGTRVVCEPGGDGAVRLHARALGPWFAGSADTAALRRAGLLTGESAAGLDALVGGPRLLRIADAF
ncbi:GNAT family N-acetyltransferase [Actinokineospora sp.]|uniref:GNAT family N-acetyltransferase n=1 Tax=Actinokineospora sp. TaxID=1872133 RepID=UPI004037BBBF